ncbi:MAG: hypothetical protein RIQ94_964 [Pseudomonadota bacterium]
MIIGAKALLLLGINQIMNADIIQIWHGIIADDDSGYQDYWRVLDASEQVRAGKIRNDLQRKHYVIVHGRLRHILSNILHTSPEGITIKKTEQGKPYLADTPKLAFNLSHSASTMVIAVGWNCQLGVDIECCKSRTNLAALVDKCFSTEEIAYWSMLPEAQKMPEFYRFWTRKEAFVKATGAGIALGLQRCVINPKNFAEFLRVPIEYTGWLQAGSYRI